MRLTCPRSNGGAWFRLATSASRRRGAALYVYVLSVTMIVAMLGTAALTTVRLDRLGTQQDSDMRRARRNAESAIEMFLLFAKTRTNWRSAIEPNVEVGSVTFGGGSMSVIVDDPADGDLANDPYQPVTVRGIGRMGEAVWVSEVIVDPIPTPHDSRISEPTLSLLNTTRPLSADTWSAQFFQPQLPAEAVGWRVEYVEVFCQRDKNVDFSINLYTAGTDSKPETLLGGIVVPGNFVAPGMDWYRFDFPPQPTLLATQNMCIGFESTDSQSSLNFLVDSGILTSSNSYMVLGSLSSGWTTVRTDRSLWYKVYGEYDTVHLEIRPGSWRRRSL